MPFYPPSYAPKLPDIPSGVSIPDFILDDKYGRRPMNDSRPFFTCGLTGKTFTPEESKKRVYWLAAGLQKELGWKPNEGDEFSKIAGVFMFNSIDTITLAWAIHKLGGIDTPANAAYSAFELEHQMRDAGAKCIFTIGSLLEMTLGVAQKIGIPKNRIYLCDMPNEKTPSGYKTLEQLISDGKNQPAIEPLKWDENEGARRTAFLCYSSGTSGLPKGVMISHRNVIANTIQISIFDQHTRKKNMKSGQKHPDAKNVMGMLPFSHIYGLVLISHSTIYQGDGVIVLPRFEMQNYLAAIQDYKINMLYIVPPVIILMTKNKQLCSKYDLSSVESLFTGAAPLGEETANAIQESYPDWLIRQGYGLTETCTVVSSSNAEDIWFGSSGSFLPGYECRVVTPEGQEITGYDQPGELLAKSPSVVLGYLNNEKANKETFVDGFMRTGDEVVIRKSPKGHEHVFIVDRIKELIKVKGLQVAPAELESALLTHPAVADCTVIPIPDDDAGERPKAFVVKSKDAGGLEESDKLIARDIMKHIEKDKARHKWIKEVEFIDEVPKSPSGKILRRLLKDKEKEKRQKKGPKL